MSEVYYYLAAYNDEVCPHAPTLDAAAWYLWYGCDVPEDKTRPVAVAGSPLAKPGEIFLLDTLRMFPDARAYRCRYQSLDGCEHWTVWSIYPALPAEADFVALRWGCAETWDEQTIGDPQLPGGIQQWLNEMADPDDVEEIEHIAVGVTGNARAVLYLDEGVPRLVIIDLPTDRPKILGRKTLGVITDEVGL